MEGKFFLGNYMIWVILLLGQLHGYKSCVQKERKALLELKKYIISFTKEEDFDSVLTTWNSDTRMDCCGWEGVKCNRTSKRVAEISFGTLNLKWNSLLNLSLLHPFEDVRSLNLSSNNGRNYDQFYGLFDNVEGYKSLGRLRNLKILDLSFNAFNNSILPFLNSATSLKTLFIRQNFLFDGPLPAKELKDLKNLELLDLSSNRFSGCIPVQELSSLRKLRSLYLSYNQFSAPMGSQGYKSLRLLRNLEILDLSGNEFNSSIFPFLNSATSLKTLFLQNNNFIDSSFPAKELKDLRNLEILDLSANRFNGPLPVRELSALRKLKSLDLSGNDFSAPMGSKGYKSLWRLRNLEILDLSENSFNSSIFPFLSAATSLKSLFLQTNRMDGPFPIEELKNLTNLELLDLSINNFNGSIPMRELSALGKLKTLDLSDNDFSGSIDFQGICEMRNMQNFDLSRNKLVGPFPLCLTNLTGLRVLDLSSNQLTGNVPSSLGKLESLNYLSLFDNYFEGFFSIGSLANLSDLRVFRLNSNSKLLRVESENSWKPKFQLDVIELTSCNLVKVPYFLIYQKDLSRIDISDNKISGGLPHWLLANNTKLEVLFLRNNLFTTFQLPKSPHGLSFLDLSVNKFNHLLPKNIGWILPHLQYMNLANNGFQGNLPSSLGNMEKIEYLNISHNSFHGKIPKSFVMSCSDMLILTLSHNKLSGEVFSESFNFTGIWGLSMDNNYFTGKIGQGLRSLVDLEFLDISDNNLTGVIPSWIGELTSLHSLLLSNNMLEGQIPISLFSIHSLRLLDLSANILSRGIPPHVNSERPVVLLLQDNNLSGVIPDTLLTNVSVLDLRNNRLSSNIPEFINTNNTHTLLLRGNNFTGSIPSQLCGLRNIQLLDLAKNRLNGSIPSCFSNKSFRFGKEDTLYDQDYGSIYRTDFGFNDLTPQTDFRAEVDGADFKYSFVNHFDEESRPNIQIKIEFATKHRYDAYWGGNLKLLFGMDLSENELSGEIPAELGVLLELQGLNLSHNKLSGVIPESFSGLKNVESLDLSFNSLQGLIPPQLTDLSSLAVFNVSFNNLSGVIPEGKQFNTFETQSFLGNPLLCGKQINKSCFKSSFQVPDTGGKDDESQIDMISFYWSSAASYVTVLLGIFSSLTFDSPWSRFWFYLVDAFIHKAKNLLW